MKIANNRLVIKWTTIVIAWLGTLAWIHHDIASLEAAVQLASSRAFEAGLAADDAKSAADNAESTASEAKSAAEEAAENTAK